MIKNITWDITSIDIEGSEIYTIESYNSSLSMVSGAPGNVTVNFNLTDIYDGTHSCSKEITVNPVEIITSIGCRTRINLSFNTNFIKSGRINDVGWNISSNDFPQSDIRIVRSGNSFVEVITQSPGILDVSLLITDNHNRTHTFTESFPVIHLDIIGPEEPKAGELLVFSYEDPLSNIREVAWDISNRSKPDATINIVSADNTSLKVICNDSGTHYIYLHITDNDGTVYSLRKDFYIHDPTQVNSIDWIKGEKSIINRNGVDWVCIALSCETDVPSFLGFEFTIVTAIIFDSNSPSETLHLEENILITERGSTISNTKYIPLYPANTYYESAMLICFSSGQFLYSSFPLYNHEWGLNQSGLFAEEYVEMFISLGVPQSYFPPIFGW